MRVTLMRHFKVLYAWKGRYTPEGFRAALRGYDDAEVKDQGIRLGSHFQRIIISSLRRTRLTLQLALGACEYRQTALLDEVPMDPFTDRLREYRLTTLTVMARIQWLLNCRRQSETRKASRERVDKFVGEYLGEEGDYLIIGHGFFLRLLARELLRRGFRGRPITYIRNGESFTYELGKGA